ncbi:hypothetical protein [Gilvibacter sediminis]|uniref:hypothetical protein n=1 Tax=Gilvibacter sediminis TaxID=379071 RepID=UPI002350D1F0|nr:hypothetical protein [Gilvibacter sediminis]MDC7998953.1 hypothetical protein [Gilvibacter sediminis]
MDKHRTEYIISGSHSEKLFAAVDWYIQNKLGGDLVESIEGLDQKYLDYRLSEGIITLHWEHYLGISVHAESSEELIKYLDQIKAEFSSI